jgi:hypothetical protein
VCIWKFDYISFGRPSSVPGLDKLSRRSGHNNSLELNFHSSTTKLWFLVIVLTRSDLDGQDCMFQNANQKSDAQAPPLLTETITLVIRKGKFE